MTKTDLFLQLQKIGYSANKVLFHPILMQFAAKYIGENHADFTSNYKVLAEANMGYLEDFDIYILGLISDPYREISAFGAKRKYVPDEVPRCLALIVNSIDDVKNLTNPNV